MRIQIVDTIFLALLLQVEHVLSPKLRRVKLFVVLCSLVDTSHSAKVELVVKALMGDRTVGCLFGDTQDNRSSVVKEFPKRISSEVQEAE